MGLCFERLVVAINSRSSLLKELSPALFVTVPIVVSTSQENVTTEAFAHPIEKCFVAVRNHSFKPAGPLSSAGWQSRLPASRDEIVKSVAA
jgi:hypothetical protein